MKFKLSPSIAVSFIGKPVDSFVLIYNFDGKIQEHGVAHQKRSVLQKESTGLGNRNYVTSMGSIDIGKMPNNTCRSTISIPDTGI